MHSSSLVTRAVVSALGVVLYIMLLAALVNGADRLFGPMEEPGLLGPILFLTTFIVSACITGTMVLLKPVTLYADGNKQEALRLFGYTVIALTAIALIVGGIIIVRAL